MSLHKSSIADNQANLEMEGTLEIGKKRILTNMNQPSLDAVSRSVDYYSDP